MNPYKKKQPYVINHLWIILPAILILMLGLMMVASSSIAIATHNFSAPFHYFYRQLIFCLLGFVLALVFSWIPIRFWEKSSFIIYFITLASLILVLIPGIGHGANGSMRWFKLAGFHVQISEYAKLSVIFYLAGTIARHHKGLIQGWRAFLNPLAIVGLMAIFILAEPDFGSTAVVLTVTILMLFLANVPWKRFLVIGLCLTAVLITLAVISPYRLQRITSFMDPWANPFTSGYQLTQALIAFGRGGLWGAGLGNGIQKLLYLPEAHTDFIFAVTVEELGAIGGTVLLLLYAIWLFNIMRLGKQALGYRLRFHGFICYGIGLWMGTQTLINLGVNMGLLPTKGLTLPLMSYGGSSLLIVMVSMGILTSIHREVHQEHISRFGEETRR
jgi:cell division protein FtsW